MRAPKQSYIFLLLIVFTLLNSLISRALPPLGDSLQPQVSIKYLLLLLFTVDIYSLQFLASVIGSGDEYTLYQWLLCLLFKVVLSVTLESPHHPLLVTYDNNSLQSTLASRSCYTILCIGLPNRPSHV